MAELPRVKNRSMAHKLDVLIATNVKLKFNNVAAMYSNIQTRSAIEETPLAMSKKDRSLCGRNIRQCLKTKIKSKLLSGTMLQICGPPMAGKSTLVDDVIQELQESQSSLQHDGYLYHSFMCKRQATLQQILPTVINTTQQGLTSTTSSQSYTEGFVLSQIHSLLQRCEKHHHIFVFHKCESLRTSGNDHEFLSFLSKLSKFWWTAGFMVSVLFTTYKKFSISGSNTGLIEVDMLTDPIDIKALLEYHAPGVDVTGYINICQKFLCFPEAVVRFAEQYLIDEATRCSPADLEKRMCIDAVFHSLLFEKRVDDVYGWLTKLEFNILIHYPSLIDSFFTEEIFFEELKTQIDVNRLFQRLKDNYVLRCDCGDRLAVHPLLVYYSKTARMLSNDVINDQSRNRFTILLSHVLKNAEENIRLHGKKGQVYGCLVQEWPNVRHSLEVAINIKSGKYDAYVKVAVVCRRLIMTCLPNECRDFFQAMLVIARLFGTKQEQGVLETYMGQIESSGIGINWKLAEEHLDSAIEILKDVGPVYHYKWALARKANVLQRQGHYQEAVNYFMKAKDVCGVPEHCEENLQVSEQQKEEYNITMEILETIPRIFLGDYEMMREKLLNLLDELDSRCPNHPDVAILLNNIGLTIERGNKDVKGALQLYQRGYIQRHLLEKICPQDMVVPLNTIGMCLARLGEFERGRKYLEKALEIQLKLIGPHYNTALTLAHIAELSLKLKKYESAYKKAKEADDMLQTVAKQHDFRLRVLNSLVHYTIIHRQLKKITEETATEIQEISAEELIDSILLLGRGIELTDYGRHDLMTSYVHGMILNLENSRDKFQAYKNEYLLFMKDFMSNNNEELDRSDGGRQLYFYIRDTKNTFFDLKKLICYMKTTCQYCQYSSEYYIETMWQDEVRFLQNQRQQGINSS